MSQFELFASEPDSTMGTASSSFNEVALESIRGLDYVQRFVSAAEEAELLDAIDAAPWSSELERRVQHYGYKYDYRSRRIDETMRAGEMPEAIMAIAERLAANGYFARTPDQCIVNEYLPGQGIAPHIDCEPCFGETIASLSLGSPVTIDFTHASKGDRHSVWLEQRSLVVLQDAARYEWKHGIARRRKDVVNRAIMPRARRVSLTFRTVVIP